MRAVAVSLAAHLALIAAVDALGQRSLARRARKSEVVLVARLTGKKHPVQVLSTKPAEARPTPASRKMRKPPVPAPTPAIDDAALGDIIPESAREPGEPPPDAALDASSDAIPQEGWLSLPDAYYFSARDLDIRPAPRMRIAPLYPAHLAAQQARGYVILRLLINEDGLVDRAEVVRSEPPGVFDDAAVAEFSAGRFTAGVRNGRPVKSEMYYEVRFDYEPPPLNLPRGPSARETPRSPVSPARQ